nr:hypothetical protein [Porphyromonas gulae]
MGSGSKKLTRHSEKNLAPLFQKKRATIRRLLVRVSVFTLSLVSFSYVPAIRRSSSGSTDTHSLHVHVSSSSHQSHREREMGGFSMGCITFV